MRWKLSPRSTARKPPGWMYSAPMPSTGGNTGKRKKAAWGEVLKTYAVKWWQCRQGEKRELAGVVINLKPTGVVEVKKGLARHEVKQQVVEATREAPDAPRQRAAVSNSLIRYVALQKSIAVHAALFRNP